MSCNKFYNILSRKKALTESAEETSKLAKFLTTLDLTALGIGSTLGVGVYVLAGEVSKTTAGPAVILSFAIAAFASLLAGLCYAEFGARVPKAGSAYIYSFVTVGEFVAFLIGWNLILEYAIGSASVVKGLSTYLDSLLDNVMSTWFIKNMGMNISGFGEYPDLFAFGVIILFSLGLAFGAKESSVVNNIFTLVNLSVVLYVIVAGSFKADPENWKIPAENVPQSPVDGEDYGTGGFAPYGISGIIKGAAICFYGFIGFDCIATAGEEAKDPKKSIPISVCVSLFVIFIAYLGISTVLTMMLPYYDQNPEAPLPHVFKHYGWTVAEYIVSIGAIFGLFASLMGAMFPLPRVIYAMAKDGLLFSFMGTIHPKFQTPMKGTLIAGTLTGILAAIFNLKQLVNMMSIGTLLAYSMVAACVLLLRFEVDDPKAIVSASEPASKKDFKSIMILFFNTDKKQAPTKETSQLVTFSCILYIVWCFFVGSVVEFAGDYIGNGDAWAIFLLVLSILCLVLTIVIISRQPKSSIKLPFTVPFLPWLPAFSILINIYLMLKLDIMTWFRFAIWMLVGLVIYFAYGIRNSKEKKVTKVILEYEPEEKDAYKIN